MKEVVYNGKDANIGRFGMVKKGAVLLLTSKEYDASSGDRRFSAYDPKKHGPINGNAQNDRAKVMLLELEEKDRVELLKIGRALEAQGLPIRASNLDNGLQLRKKIIHAMKFAPDQYDEHDRATHDTLMDQSIEALLEQCQTLSQKTRISFNRQMARAELAYAIIMALKGSKKTV